jgi:hypothetical protein
MTLAQLLAQFIARKAELATNMEQAITACVTEQGARAMNEAEQTAYDTMAGELAQVEAQIANIQAAQRAQAQQAQTLPQRRSTAPSAPAILTQDPDPKYQGQAFVRRCIAVLASQLAGNGSSQAPSIAQQRWGRSHPQLVKWIQATVGGGGLELDETNSEWGAELVQYDTRSRADFIEYLHARTIFDRIGFREVPTDVLIKGIEGTATGYWVGQGQGIPVSAMDFLDVSLSTLKVAGLVVASEEWFKRSDPSGELIVRDALVQALRQVKDGTAWSTADPVTAKAPAGLLKSVVPVSTAGAGILGARADIFALVAAFIGEKNEEGLAWVMNPSLALQLASLRTEFDARVFPSISATGGTLEDYPVFTGHNVGASHLILCKPSDIYRIGEGAIEVALSREATIEMSSTPSGEIITPTSIALAQIPVNMFQTHSLAIKAVQSCNYAKRRAGAVKYVADAAYYPESA